MANFQIPLPFGPLWSPPSFPMTPPRIFSLTKTTHRSGFLGRLPPMIECPLRICIPSSPTHFVLCQAESRPPPSSLTVGSIQSVCSVSHSHRRPTPWAVCLDPLKDVFPPPPFFRLLCDDAPFVPLVCEGIVLLISPLPSLPSPSPLPPLFLLLRITSAPLSEME